MLAEAKCNQHGLSIGSEVGKLSSSFTLTVVNMLVFYRSYMVRMLPESILVKCQPVGHCSEWDQKNRGCL